MSKTLQRVRGTQDILPELSLRFRWIEQLAWSWAQNFGYGEIDTPIFEMSEVFHRTLGETSDMVHKETYTFLDRGGDSITLRPEGTAGIARSFISEGLAQKLPLKLYYSGPMFRYERPQKGRYRQFHQIGVECLGYDTPYSDVEVIQLASQFLKDLGVGLSCQLLINTLGDSPSRQAYRDQLVAYFSKYKNDLSADSQLRLEKNPLRILDSKDAKDREIVQGCPKMESSLSEESKKFFDSVLKGLEKSGLAFDVDPRLVRGIDYYTHTVFEFVTDQLGAQGTVLAGGRYDGLIETMGGPSTPGVGWAAGLERLAELVPSEKIPARVLTAAVVPADEVGELFALELALDLRRQGLKCEILWNGNVGKKMKKASGLGAQFAVIVGSQEVQTRMVSVKSLATGEQKSWPVAQLAQALKGS
ncbi:MAG: histidine--tRNA ligase [Bdellovibrionales bacterium]